MNIFLRLLIALVYLLAATPAPAGFVINPYAVFTATPATITNSASNNSAANAASYSFATQSISTADASRIIHVAAVGRTTTGVTHTGITVGGVNCPISLTLATADNDFALCQLAVAAGTTATIAVTTSANMSREAIGVWASYNLLSSTETDEATATGDPSTTTAVDILAGGVALCFAATGATGTATWTGLTEGFDAVSESATNYTGASDAFAAASVGPTFSADYTGGNTGAGMVCQAFR